MIQLNEHSMCYTYIALLYIPKEKLHKVQYYLKEVKGTYWEEGLAKETIRDFYFLFSMLLYCMMFKTPTYCSYK